jgi:hypothetical protein
MMVSRSDHNSCGPTGTVVKQAEIKGRRKNHFMGTHVKVWGIRVKRGWNAPPEVPYYRAIAEWGGRAVHTNF